MDRPLQAVFPCRMQVEHVLWDLTGFGCAGLQCHRAAARCAGGEPGQKDRAGDDPRRCHVRVTRFQSGPNGVEFLWRDNDRYIDQDVLAFRLLPKRLGATSIENPGADINGVGQYVVNRGDTEPRPTACAISTLVQLRDDLLHT